MLGPGRYLLGVLEIAFLVVPAWLGASRVRARLLPRFEGPPAIVASAVLALALLIWAAQALGSFGAFEAVPYAVLVVLVGGALWFLVPDAASPEGGTPRPHLPDRSGSASLRTGAGGLLTAVAFLIAAVAVVHFAGGVKDKLGTGMTGFDSTWYHGPFAAGFFQSGDTWHLHFIAPQFLAWFYPANGEVLHAAGMVAFGRDLLSPLLNLGWFLGCLLACWCVGRPYRMAPWSLALGAVALSVPALADQAGEARNDIVGIFFLLAAVAVVLNAREGGADRTSAAFSTERGENAAVVEDRGVGIGALAVAGLAAGLAAGTKLNFLLPAAVLVLGLVFLAGRGQRLRALAAAGLPALAGGGYWYLRNLVHAGNPVPWIHHLGPIALPSPGQTLGGREAHDVIGYLTDGSVWSDWLLPGLHGGLWIVWPLLGLGALAGFVGAVAAARRGGRALVLAGLVGLAVALAWLVAPTSASGPDGSPRGFESGLRYLAPALVLGLALLPAVLPPRARAWLSFASHRYAKDNHTAGSPPAPAAPAGARAPTDRHGAPSLGRPWAVMMLAVVAVVAVVVGYPVERRYLSHRYEDPSFTAPGLNAAFAWARDVSDARIGTTSTRQYPLFGTDLSNRVEFIGERTGHGGFEAPTNCRDFIRLVDEGDYEYVVASRDRVEPAKSPFPPSARWLAAAGAEPVLRERPTVVFRLLGRLDPASCVH